MISADKLSVVCPTYNSAPFIREALESVASQSVAPLEVIVSDDGSTDGTRAIAYEFFANHAEVNGRVLANSHRGPGAARNAGIRAARGQWLAFIDSDDIWFHDKLSTVCHSSRALPDHNFFCHNQEYWSRNGTRSLMDFAAGWRENTPLAHLLVRQNIFTPSAVVCRRDVLLASGLFNEQLMSAQDYELWLRMAPALRVCMLPQVLGAYRDRPGNISSQSKLRHLKNCLRLLYWHRDKVGAWATALASFRIAGHLLKIRALSTAKSALIRLMRWPETRDVRRGRPLSIERRLFGFSTYALNSTTALFSVHGPRSTGRLRVLLFHHIAAEEMDVFAARLRWLRRRWQFVDPHEFCEMVRNERSVSADSLLLTFDDGFRSNYDVAQQVLSALDIRAIFFVPDGFVNIPDRAAEKVFIADRIFGGRIRRDDVPDALTAMRISELHDLLRRGHQVGCHTTNHVRLASVRSEAEMDYEIAGATERLGAMLGRPVEHFAYPFGNLGSIGPRALGRIAAVCPFVYSNIRGDNAPSVLPSAIRRDSFQPSDSEYYMDAVLRGGLDALYRDACCKLDRMAAIAQSVPRVQSCPA